MRNGRRWLALDADFPLNPFVVKLGDRFGAAGVVAFIGFLCACKRSTTPGTISYATDVEALVILGIDNIPLVDNSGQPWDLDMLWRWTGQQKQTKKTCIGRRTKITATHWSLWQKNLTRQENSERKAHIRVRQRGDEGGTGRGQLAEPPVYKEWDREEKENETRAASQNGNYVGPEAAQKAKAALRGEDG